jgi:hypothetical protein
MSSFVAPVGLREGEGRYIIIELSYTADCLLRSSFYMGHHITEQEILEKNLIAYFPLIRHGPYRKRV